MKYRLLLMLLLASIVPAAVFGQAYSASMESHPSGAVAVRTTIQPPRMLPPAITGAPYSADEISEHVQTLADGTHITQNRQIEHIYRDTQGRVRTERPMFMGPLTANANFPKDIPPMIQIVDTVAGVEYILDTQNHIAHCFTVQPNPHTNPVMAQGGPQVFQRSPAMSAAGRIAGGSGVTGTTAAPQVRQTKTESLGTQVIEGVETEGTRTTITYDAGSVGNDRPIDVTHELWRSPQLNVVVLSKNIDPRNGENTMRLQNINLAEPDASLFLPPPDYRVVNDTEAVTITFTRQ